MIGDKNYTSNRKTWYTTTSIIKSSSLCTLDPEFCKDHLEDASLHAVFEASHGSQLRERSSKTVARIIEAGESENRSLRLAGSSYQKAYMLCR